MSKKPVEILVPLYIPPWTTNAPRVKGTYLVADKFGGIRFHHLRRGMKRNSGMLETKQGLYFLDGGRFGPHFFCGPLTPKHLFTPEMLKSQKAAHKGIPAQRIREAEAMVKQYPRSRKCKAKLAALRASKGKSDE